VETLHRFRSLATTRDFGISSPFNSEAQIKIFSKVLSFLNCCKTAREQTVKQSIKAERLIVIGPV
jgi:hypothetical protein